MRKTDIVVGGLYTDGKSVRRVVDEGPWLAPKGVIDKDFVLYEAVSGRKPKFALGWSVDGNPLITCSRAAFARWAKQRIG